ncbi:hypothetical protein ACS0TY_013735 [Phlomoides rotata]
MPLAGLLIFKSGFQAEEFVSSIHGSTEALVLFNQWINRVRVKRPYVVCEYAVLRRRFVWLLATSFGFSFMVVGLGWFFFHAC